METRKYQATVRSGGAGEEVKLSEDALLKPQKNLEEYGGKLFAQKTEFFSTYNPDMIEEALVEYLRNVRKIEPKINKDKYKVKFSLATTGQDDTTQETEMCCRILKVDDEKSCVEFTKLGGNQVNFHEHYNDLTTNVLAFAHDAVV